MKAGDKIRAMKCLLKGGETEKIVYYASTFARDTCPYGMPR